MRRTIFLATVLFVLSGCASTFIYNNTSYPSRDAALAAARADINGIVNTVPISDHKVGGSLLVVIPSRDVIRRYGVTIKGTPNQEVIDYVAQVLEYGFLGTAKAVRRSHTFDTVKVVRSSDTESIPHGQFDYKLWLLAKSLNEWQWYLSKSNTVHREPIDFDNGLEGAERFASFNTSVSRATRLFNNESATSPMPPAEPDTSSRPKSIGTAFFINSNGYAVSNHHVVDRCGKVEAILSSGERVLLLVLATDAENDLALLKADLPVADSAQFRLSPPVRQGEQLTLYGYPLAGALASRGNLSTGVVSALTGLRDDSRKLQISAPVQPGNSGGPVLDQYGNIIGIVSSKLNALLAAKSTGDIPQNVNFAIKSSVVATFLEASDVRFGTAPSNVRLSTADVGDVAKLFTFRVQCY